MATLKSGLVVSPSANIIEWKIWYSIDYGSFYRSEGPASITYSGEKFWNPPEWDPPEENEKERIQNPRAENRCR